MVDKSVDGIGSTESVPIVDLSSAEAFATLLLVLIGLVQLLTTQTIGGC